MWLLSMNQRRCGSALPYFLLCFLQRPGVAPPPARTAGLEAGTAPLLSPPGEGDQGFTALGHRNPPRKGDLRRSMWPGCQAEEAGGGNGQKKVLGSRGAPLSCGSPGSAWGAAAVPSRPPAHPAGPPQRSCPPASHQLSSRFSSPSSSCSPTSGARGKVGRAKGPARAEHPQGQRGQSLSEERRLWDKQKRENICSV